METLRAFGCEVWQINGHNRPDLLVKRAGQFYALGIKSGEKSRLTASEQAGAASWPLVCSVEDACRAVGIYVPRRIGAVR